MTTNGEKLEQLRPIVRDLAKQHLEKVAILLKAYFPEVTATVTETIRSPERQKILFSTGRSKARPGQSPHEYGLAWDICLVKDAKILADKHQAWHVIPFAAGIVGGNKLVSGADFSTIRDFPHTEWALWKEVKDAGA
jgi:peptidoglycan L-alanyl-D-glutamate endopeptidase CwlK